jgi:SAM-dependent methyltransferase
MDLAELINRGSPPRPWEEGENIPWNEPEFSRRMLKEHLSQEHDAASRRFEIIDQQVDWIHHTFLRGQSTSILDLACGPGLYTERLARFGHNCFGIDYSPASIAYAIATAKNQHLSCTYTCQDIRQADFQDGMGLVMLIYGEFNAFRPSDAKIILEKAWQALEPGGRLLLEPHTYAIVKELGEKPASWYSAQAGLFSAHPHIVLQENFWDESSHAATTRYYIIDGHTGEVARYAHSLQAYTDEEYRSLICGCGYSEVQILAGLSGDISSNSLIAIIGQKEIHLEN